MTKSRALGRLFPPINAPLPLSARESQRLLDVIKKSFRAELDKQHGYENGGMISTSKTQTPSKGSLSSMPAPVIKYFPEFAETPSPPTDRHLRSILTNPLFGVRDSIKPRRDLGSPYEREKLIFEHAVSKGLMNISRAHGFLLKIAKIVSQTTAFSLNEEGLGSTGAGLLVLRWLRASNTEFLQDYKFSIILLRLVIAEGMEDLVWTWIDQRIKGNKEGLAELINAYIGAKTYKFELDPAFAAFQQVAEMLERNSTAREYLRHGEKRLNWASTVDAVQHAKPSVELFESFVALSKPRSVMTADRVHLDLHHPTNPSSDLALRYLEDDNVWDKLVPHHISSKCNKNPVLQRIMALGLDTAQHLMHTDREQLGMQILNLLGTHLGSVSKEFGYLPRPAAV